MHYAPSKMSLFLDCPLCFWLSMRPETKSRVYRPRGPFPTLPSGIDRRIKERFDWYRSRGLLPPELTCIEGVKLFANMRLLDEWRNNRIGLYYKSPNENSVRGALDDLLVHENGCRIPLDAKTRGFPPKPEHVHLYKPQLGLYNLLLEENGYVTDGRGFLVYYWPVDARGTLISVKDEQGSLRVLNENEAMNLTIVNFGECRAEGPESEEPRVGFTFATEVVEIKVTLDETRTLLQKANQYALLPRPPEPSPTCEYCQCFTKRQALLSTFDHEETPGGHKQKLLFPSSPPPG